MLRLLYRHSNPPGGEHAAKVAKREQRNISSERADLSDEAIRTVGNLRPCLPIRRAVTK